MCILGVKKKKKAKNDHIIKTVLKLVKQSITYKMAGVVFFWIYDKTWKGWKDSFVMKINYL